MVCGIAKKIYDMIVGGPDSRPRRPADVVGIRKLVEGQKTHIKKLQRGDKVICLSFGKDSEREGQICSLREQVKTTERLLESTVNSEARYNQMNGAGDTSWGRIDEERAAQFRGRQLFLPKTGLLGIASPGVAEVKVGGSRGVVGRGVVPGNSEGL